MIWAGALFDFFDGFAARMLNRYSSIGKDLDSLADLVTFCFLPASILFALMEQATDIFWIPYLGYLLVLFGAIRLARFNNDTRQYEHFYGLPVPASGIFVSAFPFIYAYGNSSFDTLITEYYTLAGIAVILSAMMISNIRLMSLKFRDFTFRGNWQRYLLIFGAMVLIYLFSITALPMIIILYVVLSVALNIKE